MPEPRRILVVDDEPSIVSYVRLGLEHEGFEVVSAESGEEGLQAVRERVPHLVLLDVMLPGLDGLQVCEEVRRFSDVPILLLTARGEPDDVVRGLDRGADAYLPKPFKLKELLARVHALLRLVGGEAASTLSWDGLELDLDAQQAVQDGRRVDLTVRERGLLQILMAQPRKIHGREALLQAVWGDGERDPKTLKACVSALRDKLGDARRRVIRSVRGVGYTLGG